LYCNPNANYSCNEQPNEQQVSILLQEKENEWSHQRMKKQQQASECQLAIIEYQVKMLKQQELIAFCTKRDNTVMKVIAVLIALFLPGAFIAVRRILNSHELY
jgi:hypothetical protein